MSISWIKKKLISKKEKIWDKFLNKFLKEEFDIININQLDDLYLSENEVENKTKLLESIINFSESYEKIINLKDFIDNLIVDFSFEDINNNNFSNFYEVIYDLYLLNNNFINELNNGYDINFWWTFKFFKINLSDYYSIADFFDQFYLNLKNINNEFKQLSWSDKSIILPHDYNSNDYFIVNYSYNKNNKILNNVSTSENVIPSSSSFYFFFKEIKINDNESELIIVFRQAFQPNKIELIKKSIDKFLWKVCFFDSLDLVDFDDLKSKWYLPSIDWDVDIISSKISHKNIKSLISIDWKKSIDETNQLFEKSIYNINEIKLEYRKYEWKELKLKLVWSTKSDSITLDWKKLYINRFLNILEWLNLISFKNIDNTFTFEEFFIDSIFNWNTYLSKKLFKWFDIIEKYIKNYTYCWNIEWFTWKKVDKSQFNFSSNKIILDQDKKDKLDWNVMIDIDIDKIFSDKTNIKLNFNYIDKIWVLSLSKQNKNNNLKILFSSDISKLTSYLSNQSNIETTKFIWFIDSDFTDLHKINIIDKFNCLLYKKNSIPSFLSDIWVFIEQESNKIFLERDRNIIKVVKRWNWDNELNIFKSSLSWNWDLFEKHVAEILSFFFPIFVSLWMKYKWESVPDWLMINKDHDALFMYDAKSSWDVRPYINKEALKFKEYITSLFPEWNNNIFFIIGPSANNFNELTTEKIESLWSNVNWKTLIEKEKWKILYMWADVLDFLHHILMFPDIVNLKWQIDLSKFTKYFLELLEIPWIKKIELDDFIYNFSKFIFKSPEDWHKGFKDFSEKMEKRTEKKVDLIGISENFKKYINDYKSLNT